MKGPVSWMARNHVAANLLMMILIVGGLVMAFTIKQEVFPEIELDTVFVSVAYPGAGPEEVEDGVILKIEESLSSITGIKEIRSVAAEGIGRVTAEVIQGEDIDIILQDIKAEVDRITTFPEDAEKPVVSKTVRRREVVSAVVYGDASERSLREQAEAIRDELLDIPEITQVDLRGVRPYELSIEVTEETLSRYGLTLGSIADKIRETSIDLPGGTVKSRGGEILIRTKGKRYTAEDYEGVTIIEKADGTDLKLGDIADVRDTFRETDEFSLFDGMPSAMISVYRVGDQKPLQISRIVTDYVEQKRKTLPDSLDIAVWNDFSEIYKSRLNLLLRNAFLALILISIVLGLFLQIRLAMWVMLGIPISFLGAIFLMPSLDVSINMLSLFAFILALGIVVDDAIVVGENVYTHRGMGKKYIDASIDGTLEVAGPVIFSVLTSVAAFLPLIYVSGMMGKFIKVIPFVVIPILLISLIESLLILPAHLSLGRTTKSSGGIGALSERIRERFSAWLDGFISGTYTRQLTFCIKNRYTTFATAIALLLLTVGIVGGGIIKFSFMPRVDGDVIFVSLKMPIGTPVEDTAKAQEYIVNKAQEVIKEYDENVEEGKSVLRHIYSLVGGSIIPGPMSESVTSGSHKANVILLLTESEKRGIPAYEISNKLRKAVGTVPGADSLSFDSSLVHFGANIDIQLAHEDSDTLEAASERIKSALADYPGVDDIEDNYTRGKRELKLRLKPEARMLGISERELGRQVRAAFFGSEALRIQRGRNEVKVMVRYPEADRKSMTDLLSMRIRTPDGREIPFIQAAHVEEGRGFTEINRADRKRITNITASVDDKAANAGEIRLDLKATVLADLKNDFPGLSYDMEGEEKERKESMDSMRKGFLLALFLIYTLLAIPFRSYFQPFIIMASIPFGFVGAVAGHLIMGKSLSLLSLFGMVALTGVVVNDSLLLINFINKKRETTGDLYKAVIEGTQRRFRPIILTSLTTSFGLTPIIFERSIQAQFLIPMAISLGFGILFATLITLLLVPSLYVIFEDIKGHFVKAVPAE